MEIKELYSLYKQNYKVTTDTRSDLDHSIFFALKGDNFNGNKYAEDALNKGALYAVVDEEAYQTNEHIILVDDVLLCLQNLAKYHRQQLNIPVIALTGSNGKTTTKELIHAVLKEEYLCAATKGNLNNHIGVPLTLLAIQPKTDIAVIEMGANHPEEIAALCEIALPDFGYITNFGRVHLEGFKSLEGVIKAKTELYEHLKKNSKVVFVNTFDEVQVDKSQGMNVISFGGDNAKFPVAFVSADPFVTVSFNDTKVYSQLIGKYNYLNIATAVAFGKYFEVKDALIKKAIENYIPSNNRSQIIIKGNNKIILDAYNANPNSMAVALENLFQLTDKNKIAILGDMFEIGKNTAQEHQIIADLTKSSEIKKAFLIGSAFFETASDNSHVFKFKTFEDFTKYLGDHPIENATILIKASRGMALERLQDLL